MQKQNARGYLFLHNIGKKNNIGNIIRSACAFGIDKVMYISNKQETKKMKIMKEFNMFGNQGTAKQIQYQPFVSFQEVRKYFAENDIQMCGVQIGQGSKPVNAHPFIGHTAFFLGNEGTGLLPVHKQYCDYFIYIPQYTEKTASLNVSVAAGIIFHHFALWAGYEEAKLYGQKYQLQLKEEDKKEKINYSASLNQQKVQQEGQQKS